MTKRQRLEAHRASAGCAACHSLMDPLGLPLESYDAIGKYRTTDNGLPVDPTSTFDGQAIADSKGLGVVASQSVTVAQCLVRKYYAYAVGHQEHTLLLLVQRVRADRARLDLGVLRGAPHLFVLGRDRGAVSASRPAATGQPTGRLDDRCDGVR